MVRGSQEHAQQMLKVGLRCLAGAIHEIARHKFAMDCGS